MDWSQEIDPIGKTLEGTTPNPIFGGVKGY